MGTNNLGFIGTSAGGHLSLLYSYAYNTSNYVKMVASIVGPTNFADPNYYNNPIYSNLYTQTMGFSYQDNPTLFQNLSPLYKVTATAPPTVMLYGNQDPLVPTTQGQALHDKLNQLGVYNQFNLYNGGHGNWAPIDQLDAYTKLINFIKLKF
jgi:acetyl esterase/lipase